MIHPQRKFFSPFIFIAVLGAFVSFSAWAETVSQILVEGNKKIETDAITAKLVSKKGETFSLTNVRKDVQQLFDTCYFFNVKMDKQGSGNSVILKYI
ncbi:MAG: hypothetical protein KDD34_06960, partial [Bdellovibrionales bacterium]|nr:hypothetical protein [Bdellovibrionales bacterium]